MDADSLLRITEFLHALKILIAAAKRLTSKDIVYLLKIVDLMEKLEEI